MGRGQPGVYTTPYERMLLRKVVDADGCWVWPGSLNGNKVDIGGYGQIGDTIEHKVLAVHVVSYEHHNGALAPGYEVDHLCHTEACTVLLCKHRRCWNPAHLEATSHADNDARGNSPGAIAVRTGWCQKGLHERTPENLDTWVRPSGTVRKQCRPCRQASQQRRYQLLKVVG